MSEYSSLETVGGLLAYTAVGCAAGFIGNVLAPPCDKDASTGQLAFEAVAQLATGYLVSTEAMRLVMPKRENWLPPASDASVLIGMWSASPEMRCKFDEIHRRANMSVKQMTGLADPPLVPVEQVGTQPPEEGEA